MVKTRIAFFKMGYISAYAHVTLAAITVIQVRSWLFLKFWSYILCRYRHFTVQICFFLVYATCVASGDPHYSTFDGSRYDFMGQCEYIFAKDTERRWFEIKQVNDRCGNGGVTCTKAIGIWFPSLYINLERGTVEVNGSMVMDFTSNGKFINNKNCK